MTLEATRRGLLTAALSIAGTLAVLPAAADTVLITGANSGIGLELTKQFAAKGWTVIATHRRSEVPASLVAVIAEHDSVRVERMDVTNVAQVQALAAQLADVPIDVLINNAGVYNDRGSCAAGDEDCPGDWGTQSFGNLRFGLFDTMMAVNVKGPLIVSEAFIDHVKAGTHKKIVSITSTHGSLTAPLGGSGAIFYRTSKAALNRAMQLVARAAADDGVTVVLMHPGAVLTERQAHLQLEGMIETPLSVTHMIETIESLDLEDSGRFLQYDGVELPW